MQLYEYLQRTKEEKETNLSRYTRFGRQIGVSLHSIRQYVSGGRGIKDRTKRKIVAATEGKVRWHDLVQE